MPKARKLAALLAALLIPLSAVRAETLQLQSAPMLIDVQPRDPVSTPDNFHPIEVSGDSGGFRPMRIDGARDEARVDFDGPGRNEDDDDERPGLQTRQFEMQVALSCRILGDDLIIANKGSDVLAAGTTIKWQVKGGGQKGYLAMESDVLPGKGFRAAGVLNDGADSQRCTARGV